MIPKRVSVVIASTLALLLVPAGAFATEGLPVDGGPESAYVEEQTDQGVGELDASVSTAPIVPEEEHAITGEGDASNSAGGVVATGATDLPLSDARSEEPVAKGEGSDEAGRPAAGESEAAPVDANDAGGAVIPNQQEQNEAPDQDENAATQGPAAGVYEIASAVNRTRNVDVTGGSKSSSARIDLYDRNSTKAQRFRIAPIDGSDYSVVYNVGSGLVLDVKNGQNRSGAAVQQYVYNGSDAQRWQIVANDDGSYSFISALRTAEGGLLALDLPGAMSTNGSRLQLYALNGSLAQHWFLGACRTVEDGVYTVASGVSGDKTLDVSGGGLSNGANVQVWDSNGTIAQLFYVRYDERTGYYNIQSVNSGKMLDVSGASHRRGANAQQYAGNGSFAQAWSIEPVRGTSGYRLVCGESGLVLDVSGASSSNGTNVQQWSSNGTKAQLWFLESAGSLEDWLTEGVYTISPSANGGFLLDVASGSRSNYARVQLCRGNGTGAQAFQLIRATDGGYLVRNVRSGKYLTIGSDAGSAAFQSIVDGTPSAGQLWNLSFGWDGLGLAAQNGYVLDVRGNAYRNGNAVQGYTPNGTVAQLFRFHSSSWNIPGITDVIARVGEGDGTKAAVYSQYVGDDVYLFLPSNAKTTNFSLESYSPSGARLVASSSRVTGYSYLPQDGRIDLADFANDGSAYRVYLRFEGQPRTLLLRVMKSANLRSMFLTSDDAAYEGRAFVEASKDHSAKAKGSMLLVDENGNVTYNGALSQIKGRGNSTWGAAKKPYQIKLDKKTSLIDGKKGNRAKTWVLLANYSDPSLMRNFITSQVAQALGLSFTPQGDFVDLYYDGEYRGTYQLSEKVEVNGGRVDISEIENGSQDDTDIEDHDTAMGKNSYGNEFRYVKGVSQPKDITGGYLVELDQAYYAPERSWFTVKNGTKILHFVLKSPEDASEEEVRYISERFQRAFDHQNLKDVESYIDIDQLARVFLVEELAKNPDYIKHSSTYFYVDAGDPLVYAGPVWDFDNAYGIDINSWYGIPRTSPKGLTAEGVGVSLDNPLFRRSVKTIFNNEVKALARDLVNTASADGDKGGIESVSNVAARLAASERMNELLWGFPHFGFVQKPLPTYEENVRYLRNWLAQRTDWLDGYFNSSSWA